MKNIEKVKMQEAYLEDRIKDIYASVMELEALSNVLYSSMTSDAAPPEMSDIKDTVYVLKEHVKKTKEDICEFMTSFEQSSRL